jgi:hypothetical protein
VGQDVQVTDTYKAFRLVEHLRYMNRFRASLIEVFNSQVLGHIARSSALPVQPILKYTGKETSEEELQNQYAAFQAGEIDYRALVEKLL